METPSFILKPESWTDKLPIEEIYGRNAPLEVDVGCGKGRFLAVRAEAEPGTLFLGVDRLLRRLRKADRKLLRRGVTNVRLLRIEASYAVTYLLPAGSVSVFYIFFPDPWPKKRHHRRRLFAPPFVESLHRALEPGGRLHVATDHIPYFEAILALLSADTRFDTIPPYEPATAEERTEFETLFLGQGLDIGRCSFRKREQQADKD